MILGSTNISALKLGSSAVQKVMLGATEVWSAFSPLDLSPALWLSDTGSDASVWPDLSGNGRNATQGTPANRPAIITNALNGRQVRRFDGGDFLALTATAGMNFPNGFTVFAIQKTTNTTGINAIAAHWSPTPGINRPWIFIWIDQVLRASVNSNAAIANSASIRTTGASLIAARYDKTNVIVYQNGSSVATAPYTTSLMSASAEQVTVGCERATAPTSYYLGDIAEILIFPAALSTENRQKVEAYLNSKWAIY